MMKWFHLKATFVIFLFGSFSFAQDMFQYMPYMHADPDKRMDNERNIMDETCEGVNVTGVFLNNDPDLSLNLQGQITILFKIAPHYLYLDQIAMIRQLRNIFDENGYNALQFLLVISHLGDERLQKKFESEIRLLMMDDNLNVINETKDSKPLFRMTNNQAYVLDNCGRLTYIIVPPWSHIQFPYVKAAILSTIYDLPCGDCDTEFIMQPYPGYGSYAGLDIFQSEGDGEGDEMSKGDSEESVKNYTSITTEGFTEETTTQLPNFNVTDDVIEHELDYDWYEPPSENIIPNFNESSTEQFSFNDTMIDNDEGNDDNYSIPLRIILPVEHLHYNPSDETYSKYNYITLNTKDQSFHGHLESDTPSEMENVLNDKESNAQELLNGLDEPVKELYISQTGQIYQLLKEYYVKGQRNSFKEVALLDTDIIRDDPKITNIKKITDIKRHYENLVQWLSYQFD